MSRGAQIGHRFGHIDQNSLGTPKRAKLSIIAKFQTSILPAVVSFPKLAQLNPSATNNDISVLLPQIKINPSDVQMLDCQIVLLCRCRLHYLAVRQHKCASTQVRLITNITLRTAQPS